MSVKEVVLEELSDFEIMKDDRSIPVDPAVLKDIHIDLKVVAGSLVMTVGELSQLSAGSILPLKQRVEEPMQLFYGDHLIADGILVVADDRLGLRVTKVHYSAVSK